MIYSGLFILLLIVIFAGASLAGLTYIWIRAAQRPTANAGIANCGRCRYPLFGLSSLTCPECGSDFTRVGILAPNMHKRYISPITFVLFWTLCLIVPAFTLSAIAVYVGPQAEYFEEDAQIEPINQTDANFESILLNRSHIGMYTSEWEDQWLPGYHDFLDVDIYGLNDENVWYEVDLKNQTFLDISGFTTTQGKPLTRASVETWLGEAGADLKHPDVQKQVDELYNTITQTREHGLGSGASAHFNSTGHNSYSYDMPHVWFVLFQPAVWLVVYTAGILGYILLRVRYERRQKLITLEAIQKQQESDKQAEAASQDAGSALPTA